MQNDLNNTQTTPKTANPQNTGGRAPGASDSADFQQTAPQNTLTQNNSQQLSVQSTGQPATGTAAVASVNSLSLVWWAVIIVTSIVVGSILAIKFLGDNDSPAPAAPVRKSSAARISKKTARTKSGKPAKKRRQSSKKHR